MERLQTTGRIRSRPREIMMEKTVERMRETSYRTDRMTVRPSDRK